MAFVFCMHRHEHAVLVVFQLAIIVNSPVSILLDVGDDCAQMSDRLTPYGYYHPATCGLDMELLIEELRKMPSGSAFPLTRVELFQKFLIDSHIFLRISHNILFAVFSFFRFSGFFRS